jgi:hypothetical protein
MQFPNPHTWSVDIPADSLVISIQSHTTEGEDEETLKAIITTWHKHRY